MKKACFLLFLSFISLPPILAQTLDTTGVEKHKRNICYDQTRSDIQKSVRYFSEVIESDSNDLEAYYNLGMSYYKLLAFDSAILVFDKLIALDSCYNYALFNRALCKFFQKDKTGACEDFKRAMQCPYPDTTDARAYFEKYCK